LLIDCSEWSEEQQVKYDNLRNELKIWREPIEYKNTLKEYPDT